MILEITPKLVIPNNEIAWRFSRSSGPGGQNVNKIESKVEIIFNINKSKTLSSFQKHLLLNKLDHSIINGCISIKVQTNRSQFKNREMAIKKLQLLIKETIIYKEETRKERNPSISSQRRRLESKKRRGKVKRNRQNKFEIDL